VGLVTSRRLELVEFVRLELRSSDTLKSLKMIREDFKKEVNDLLQFTTMLSIFFISIIDILFKYANSTPQEVGSTQLKWIGAVMLLIICFLAFKMFNNHFSERVLKVSKILLFIEISLFIPVIFILSIYLNTITSYFALYSLKTSLIGMMVIPVFLLGSFMGLPDFYYKIHKKIFLR